MVIDIIYVFQNIWYTVRKGIGGCMLYPSPIIWKRMYHAGRVFNLLNKTIDGSESRKLFWAISVMNQFLYSKDRVRLDDTLSVEALNELLMIAVERIRNISHAHKCDVYYCNYALYAGRAEYIRHCMSLSSPTSNGLPF